MIQAFLWIVAGLIAIVVILAVIQVAKGKARIPGMPGIGQVRALAPALSRTWRALVVAAAVVLAVLVLMPAFFPAFTSRYQAYDGPVFLLLVLLASMAILHAIMSEGGWRNALLAALGAMLLFAVLPPAWKAFQGDPSSTSASGIDNSGCDGKLRIFSLSNVETPIFGGVPCKIVEWGRTHAVTLKGDAGSQEFPAGPGGNARASMSHWRCSSALECRVKAYFCPSDHAWNAEAKLCKPPRGI